MSDAKYTKEPWSYEAVRIGANIYHEKGCISVSQDEEGRYGGIYEVADAARIVACVNKCAGIQDLSSAVLLPADTLEKVREALEMGAKLAQAQHVAKTYGACTDALSLLAAAQKQEKETT